MSNGSSNSSQTAYQISSEGFENMVKSMISEGSSTDLHKNVLWTDDYRAELPIKLSKEGTGSLEPTTIIDEMKRIIK